MVVEETTVYEVAAMPPKLTLVIPVKLVPVIVTVVPAVAEVGVKEVKVGGGKKVNPTSESFPVGVKTFTFPLAPEPTTAVIEVEDSTLKLLAGTPPKVTEKAPPKFKPVIFTVLPVPAIVGANDNIFTGG
jgi:hypothetical protein